MLSLHDSLTKKNLPFRPRVKGEARLYHCGPTVYDHVHIGNLRSFLLGDMVRRTLEHRGVAVTQIMNITDVGHMLADADEGEDKMEQAAEKAGKTPQEVAEFYTESFFRDIDRIGIRRATVYPRASAHVPEMVAMIQKLLSTGHAYQVAHEDGAHSVYFDVSSFPAYGKLSGNTVEALDAGARVEVRKDKKHPADFALWIHNPKHLMQWEAPWGAGYPGWHIECSAMAVKYLGDTLDIHTGGEDNKFPHHECEIAQSESATGKPFAKYWLHATHLLVDGQKMSKSKGNFYTLQDLLDKGYAARTVRYLLVSTHYRQQLNFTLKGLDGATAALARLDAFADAVRAAAPEAAGRADAASKEALKAFDEAMKDDLNAAAALAAIFGHVTATNASITEGTFTKKAKEGTEKLLAAFEQVFGFTLGTAATDSDVPPSVRALIEKRDEARKEKRFAESDRLRDEIKAAGFIVEDTPEGRRIKRV